MAESTLQEGLRRIMTAEVNSKEAERERLEADHGQVWNTEELQRDFQVCGFMAPFVLVVRREDNVQGKLMFQHSPRYYFDFREA